MAGRQFILRSVNSGDRVFFLSHDLFRQREITERGGLPLAGAEHPLEKRLRRTPLGVVGNVTGNNDPGERSNRIGAWIGCIHDGRLEVIPSVGGVPNSGRDAFQTGFYIFSVLVPNSSVTEVVLQSVDEL